MERHYFLTVCLTYAVGLLPLVVARALKRAGVSAEYFRGALIVYTRRHVAAVGLYGFEVSSYADICGFSDIDIMAASVAGRL